MNEIHLPAVCTDENRGRFSVWYHTENRPLTDQRRWRDLNPRTGCPAYRISSADPSATWVHLHIPEAFSSGRKYYRWCLFICQCRIFRNCSVTSYPQLRIIQISQNQTFSAAFFLGFLITSSGLLVLTLVSASMEAVMKVLPATMLLAPMTVSPPSTVELA